MTELRELTMLQRQIDKLDNAKPRQRRAIEDAVRLWGTRLHTWIKDTERKLELQIFWLDNNQDASTYEQRFSEWESLLRQYEQSCDLLRVAESRLSA